ncbi:MAG TPA: GNAT family N-acetyltransferase [Rhizomicrobium sp.]
MKPDSDIVIRPARTADSAALVTVEASAGTLFRSLPALAWIADEPFGEAEDFLPLIAAGTVWVAQDRRAGVIGELRAEIWGEALHVLELAVARDFQQRGIGRRLLDAARTAARARGLVALTLTTFRNVAWNAPFYARYGFAELSEAGLDAALRETLRAEAARGLPDRCAMRLDIRPVRN